MGLMPTKKQGVPFADPNAPAQDSLQESSQDSSQDSSDQSNVSPQEQQVYDTVMGKAAEIIYTNGHVMPEILKSLSAAKDAPQQGGSNPSAPADAGDGDGPDAESAQEDQSEGSDQPQAADETAGRSDQQKQADHGNPAVIALANTAVQVVQKLDVSSQQAGFHIPDDILYHAGAEIVGMLAEVAEAAGFHDYSQDEINGAFYQAVDDYRPIAEQMGRTNDATLKSQFGQIEQADQQGQLGQLLPGIDQATGDGSQSSGDQSQGG